MGNAQIRQRLLACNGRGRRGTFHQFAGDLAAGVGVILLCRHIVEQRRQRSLVGQGDAFLLRRDEQDGAIVRGVERRQAIVYVGQGDRRQQFLCQSVVVGHASGDGAREEVLQVALGEGIVFDVVALVIVALVLAQEFRLGARRTRPR